MDPDPVLPISCDRDEAGSLRIGGCGVAALAAEHGTPLMLADEAGLRAAAREYLEEFRSRHAATDVYFASKALPSPAVTGLFAEEGLGCDVSSEGELAYALAGGVPAERILLHGNAKTDADIAAALEAGVGLVVVDNLDDIDRLERLVTRPQAVLLRINPGVATRTHAAMATGHDGSKFGVPAPQVGEALRRLRGARQLELEGLHVHVGSQITELEPFDGAVGALAGLDPFAVYDAGGGLGVRYRPQDPPVPSVGEYAERLVAAVHARLGRDCRLIVEPGRSLVARSIVTAYSVISVKHGGPRTFAAVDGGMADNLEPMLYGVEFAPFILDADRQPERCDVVGPHCETGDRLAADVELARPQVGDVMVVPVTGAYCASLANNYNGARRPPMLLCRDGAAATVTRRETMADLLARHVTPRR